MDGLYGLPLDSANIQNGSLEIAVGSNKIGVDPVIDLHTGQPQDYSMKQTFRAERFKIIRTELNPEDTLLFHALTYHNSEPNNSDLSRLAWATVWLDH